jgi:hypothetical protein
MSSIMIRDLSHSKELDRHEMSAVSGGTGIGSYGGGALANVNVNVGVVQNLEQLQYVNVSALNNVGVIGAGFVAPRLDVSPTQMGHLSAAPTVF